jgi:FkbM family methyltransferase
MLREIFRRWRGPQQPEMPKQELQPTISPPWEEPWWYEPDVSLLLAEALFPGDIFFDVGANIGGLSSIASQIVGPRGLVVAFEGSPRVMPELNRNLMYWRANNVFLVHALVTDVGGGRAPIFYGASNVSDSMMVSDSSRAADAEVPTVALDDFVERFSLKPSLVKMDIEGAEYLALRGGRRLWQEFRVPFVLEVNPRRSQAADILLEAGYHAIDLATLRPHLFDGTSRAYLRNVLFVHSEDKSAAASFSKPHVYREVEEIRSESFSVVDGNGAARSRGDLSPGRYMLTVCLRESTKPLGDESFGIAVWQGGRQLLVSISLFNHYATNYSSIPFRVLTSGPVELRLTHGGAVCLDSIDSFKLIVCEKS